MISIDLGTTFSTIAFWHQQQQQPLVIPFAVTPTMPSWVNFSRTPALVGWDAKRCMSQENSVFDSKRIIGQRSLDDITPPNDMKWPFELEVDDETETVLMKPRDPANPDGWMRFHPEQISAIIVWQLLQYVPKHTDIAGPVTTAVITVPASFGPDQIKATIRAGKIAGLAEVHVYLEASAAAMYVLHYHNKQKKTSILNATVMVFDFGGGTLDLSVVKFKTETNVQVLAQHCHGSLGGNDIDVALANYIEQRIAEEYPELGRVFDEEFAQTGRDQRKQQKLRLRVRLEAEKAKITLSTRTAANVSLDAIVRGYEEDFGALEDIEITREEFVEECRPILDEAVVFVKDSLQKVARKLKKAAPRTAVQHYVLVGGSSQIPYVKEKLREFLGRDSLEIDDPMAAVAKGGVLFRRCISGTVDTIQTEIKVPQALGVEIRGRDFLELVSPNVPLPYFGTKSLTTLEDNQTEARFKIFRGESKYTDENDFVGEISITGFPPAARGVQQFDLNYTATTNGLVTFSAWCRDDKNNRTKELVVDTTQFNRDTLVEKLREDIESYLPK